MGAHYRFVNPRSAPVTLVIEPWAEVELVPPSGVVDFELKGDNALIEFGWDDENPVLFVWADDIGMTSSARTMEWGVRGELRGGLPPTCWFGPPWEVTK